MAERAETLEREAEDSNGGGESRRVSRRRKPWPMFAAAVTFVIVAFLSWYGSWFGRPLSDAQITEYLNDNEKPRHIQHALDQIVGRMNRQDQSVRQWYPKIQSLAQHPVPQVREWAAVTMGHDTSSEEFHRTVASMLRDEDRIVRSTAALWLVRYNDASGRAEIVEMLKPSTLATDAAGVVELMVEGEGAAVAKDAPVFRVKQADGRTSELRAPIDSRVQTFLVSDGEMVEAGASVVVLSPGINHVENALVALHRLGQLEDLPYIEHYTQDLPGMPEHTKQQAVAAITAIRDRASR